MPTSRRNMAAAVLEDKIWVIGGAQMGHNALNIVEVYDPSSDQWSSQFPNCQYAREDACAETRDGKIYLFGGIDNGQLISQVEMFDPVAGAWQTISQMPTPRRGMASVVVGQAVWLIGGASSSQSYYDLVEIYYPASNIWDTLTSPLNTGRVDPMSVNINGSVFVLGGFFGGPVASVELYDTLGQQWQTIGNMLYHCGSSGAIALQETGWIIGGMGHMGVLDKVQEFYYHNGNLSWSEIDPLNIPRRELAAVVVQDRAYAIGGRGSMGGMTYNTVEEYDLLVGIRHGKSNFTANPLLMSNFPNPFNHSTQIRLILPENDDITIKIFDLNGRLMTTLFKGRLSEGVHSFDISGSNFPGILAASGVYLVRTQSRKLDQIHKIHLIK